MGIFDSKKKKSDAQKKEEKARTIENAGLTGASAEVVQRYGSAVKEHLVINSGVDSEAGQILNKSLKGISKQNVNPDYEYQNIKQQAGFSAELKETARENAERIINKENTRVTRTDDIGRVNDPLFDHVELDSSGKIIADSGSQMKFVGSNPKEALNKLASKKFEKYLDADAKITVPSDFYDGIKAETQVKINDLQKQIETLKANGNHEAANQRQVELEKYKKIDKNLKKSKVSNKEAIEARIAPGISTAKDIIEVSHKAGVEQAKLGAAIGGGMSLVRNIVDVVKGDKDPDEAALAVVKDTATGTVVSYSTAFAGSTIKGSMQNAGQAAIRKAGEKAVKEATEKALKETGAKLTNSQKNKIMKKAMEEAAKNMGASTKLLQNLSKTNLPATIVTVTLETGKTLRKYFKGEIDGVECLTELGEKGTGMVSSTMFAVVGQVIIPIPVIGGMIGGMVGYALSSACYNELVNALQEAKLAREERIRIEQECEEAIKMIRQYRMEMEKLVSEYLIDHITTFHAAFNGIKGALKLGDIDGFIANTNTITKKLGKQPQFESFNEFDALMKSNVSIKL